MKETEITVQVFNSFNEIKTILENKNFRIIENYKLNDWYFSKEDNVKDMKYIDLMNKSFLVRQILSDNEMIELCYKKKEIDKNENVISEEKIKTKVSSLKEIIDIFNFSGLNNYCVVKNNSYVFDNGIICFVVQIIENLGIFIEFEENESMLGMNEKEKIDKMSSIINSLGLNLGNDYSCKKNFMLLHKENNKNRYTHI